MQERLTGATTGFTDEEVDWHSFATPPQSSSGLHKAVRDANRELRLLQQASEQSLGTVDRNDTQASSGVALSTLRTQKLTKLCNAASWIEADVERDRETVDLLKRFYLDTLDEAGMRRMADCLFTNRVIADKIENLAAIIKENPRVLAQLLEENDGASGVGRRLAQALQVRFEERVEELWQLHLLGAWVGVQSECDCPFRSPWMDASNEALPSRENEQPKPATRSGLSDQASGSDGETLPKSVDGVRDATMRDTSSLESAKSRAAQPLGSVSSRDGPPAPPEAVSETTVRASPPADTGGGAVSSDESQDSPELANSFSEYDIALYRALELVNKSRYEALDQEEVVELFKVVGPENEGVLPSDLLELRASFEDFRTVRWQIARSEQLFGQLEDHSLPYGEVKRLGRLIDANGELAERVRTELIPGLQRFRQRQAVAKVAIEVAERMEKRLWESMSDLSALHRRAIENDVPIQFSHDQYANWLDLNVDGGQGEMRPERHD